MPQVLVQPEELNIKGLNTYCVFCVSYSWKSPELSGFSSSVFSKTVMEQSNTLTFFFWDQYMSKAK